MQKRNIFISIVVVITVMLAVSVIQAQQTLHVKDVIMKMREAYSQVETLWAVLQIQKVVNGKQLDERTANFRYRAPDTFLISFGKPYGQKIYSDSKTLQIWIPQRKILGEQKLDPESGSGTETREALDILLKRYNFNYVPNDEPKNTVEQNSWVLVGTAKATRVGFREIKLWVDRKTHLIKKIRGRTLRGDTVAIVFSQIEINPALTEQDFQFDLPANYETIDNPLFPIK